MYHLASITVIGHSASPVQIVRHRQYDVIERVISLAQNHQLLLEQFEHRLEAFSALLDAKNLLALVSVDLLNQLGIHAKIASESNVGAAPRKRGVLVVAVDTIAALPIELLGMVHGIAGADEADVNLTFMAGSIERPGTVERNAGLGIGIYIAIGKK